MLILEKKRNERDVKKLRNSLIKVYDESASEVSMMLSVSKASKRVATPNMSETVSLYLGLVEIVKEVIQHTHLKNIDYNVLNEMLEEACSLQLKINDLYPALDGELELEYKDRYGSEALEEILKEDIGCQKGIDNLFDD